MVTGLPGNLSPAVRQEFFEPPDRMFRDAPEHIAEPDKRIDPDEFAGRNEAAQDGGSPASVVASEKSPVIPTHCEAPQRPLGAVMPRAGLCRVSGARRLLLGRIANLPCAKNRHNHRPSRKESNESAGWKRSGARPEEVVWASARSLICMSACR
jgi:hypothetical protein